MMNEQVMSDAAPALTGAASFVNDHNDRVGVTCEVPGIVPDLPPQNLR